MKPASNSNRFSFRKSVGCHSFTAAWLLVGLCLVFVVGCEPHGKPNPANRPIPSDQVLDFATLYGQNCAGCHGLNGQMGPAPPLNDELFRAMLPEKELEAVLMQGRKDTLMPAFAQENGGTLTATQIQVLVHEIKGLDFRIVETTPGDPASATVVAGKGGKPPAWGRPAELPPGVPSYKDGSIKPENLETSIHRGIAAYARACADCHGEQGHGLKEDRGIANAINDPVFLSLNSNQVLRRIIITGRADLGMPNYAESRPDSPEFKPLTEQEVSDLVALLASWRRATGPMAQPK
jgi:cytochrome c oxidase cbb3-type subunit III